MNNNIEILNVGSCQIINKTVEIPNNGGFPISPIPFQSVSKVKFAHPSPLVGLFLLWFLVGSFGFFDWLIWQRMIDFVCVWLFGLLVVEVVCCLICGGTLYINKVITSTIEYKYKSCTFVRTN